MRKDILILNSACGDFSSSDNDRSIYIAEMLSKEHNVELLTSDFNHTTKSKKLNTPDDLGFKATLLSEPGYSKNVSFRRLYSHHVFGSNVKNYLMQRKKPDVVFCEIPSLSAPLQAARYCKKNGIRFVLDILDMWPETFKMVFSVPVISDLAFMPLRRMEHEIFRSADAICAVSERDVEQALLFNSKCSKGKTVYWGTELSAFDKNAADNPVTDKSENEIWLGYCGSLGYSYDLPCVFNAMIRLRDEGRQLPVFIVMGDGPRRSEFEDIAGSQNLPVRFLGRLPYEQVCGLLRACDILVNPIVEGSAASIIRKHADYAAAGRPVLSTQDSPEYQRLIDKYQMGFHCGNHSSAELAEKIVLLTDNPDMRNLMGANSRKCAVELFDRAATYPKIISSILGE